MYTTGILSTKKERNVIITTTMRCMWVSLDTDQIGPERKIQPPPASRLQAPKRLSQRHLAEPPLNPRATGTKN